MTAGIPFRPVLDPWLERAERAVRLARPELASVLADGAVAGLVGGLARDLSWVTAPALVERFLHHPGRAVLDPSRTEAYETFVAGLVGGGMGELVGALPELGVVVDLVVDQWCAQTTALIDRLAADAPALAPTFGTTLPIGDAVAVTESVVVLWSPTTGSEHAVVYKARPVEMDVGFAELLRWVDRIGLSDELLVPTVLDRAGYGWMTHVRSTGVGDDRRAYLRRVGMLLALVTLLGGGDVHAGNVQVADGRPVVVDAEVLLRPRRASDGALVCTPLTSGWLPTALETDRCGLAAELHDERPDRWVHPGTDAMRRRPLRSPFGAVRPAVAALFAADPAGDADALVAGYREVHRLVQDRGLPLEVFGDAAPRVLLRTSHRYQETVERSLESEALASADRRRAVLDGLVGEPPPALAGAEVAAEVQAALAAAEHDAMARLAVPRCTMPADDTVLCCDGTAVGELPTMTPLARARRFVAEATPAQLDDHCDAIRGALVGAAHLGDAAPHLRIELT
ncbi:MAG: DUF4135 domain-containing protein [Acidimicrobiales bacterium]